MPALLRREIAGVPVADLARDFGTPTYVYDAAAIQARIEELRAFDVVRYAQKANSSLAILDLCRRHGVLVDAVSAGEIHRAFLAGYVPQGDPPPIVYTADIFDRESLELVVEYGVAVDCGSPDMIDQYAERGGTGALALRVNPGFGHGHSRKTNTGGEDSKHGIWFEDVPECLRRAQQRGLSVTTLHMHIGSGADLEHLALVAGAMERCALDAGPGIRCINTGGGLPVPYRAHDPRMDVPRHFAIWDAARKRLEDRFGHALRLEIEPGRFLVAEAGFLITEIRAIKRMGDNTFYLVDAGFNTLARPILYGAYHPMSLAARDMTPRAERDVVVGGPLCESGDIFTQDEGGVVRSERLPEARVGEYLVIERAGAYGFVMSSNYNGKTQPAEVLVSEGKAHLVRARQTLADLVRGETIPEG